MQDRQIAEPLVAATDHLRAALIRKTRTDRIIGRSGLRPSWAPPSYIAHGAIGQCDLADLTRGYYHVKRGMISPDEVLATWRGVFAAVRAGESVAGVLARALTRQVPGMALTSTPAKEVLTQLAEYSAITAMCVGSIEVSMHGMKHDTGKLKLEISGNRLYMGKVDAYIAKRFHPLWEANRTCDNPCGKRERPSPKLNLVVNQLSREFPEYARRIVWLARLAVYTGNEDSVIRGFDVVLEKDLDDNDPAAVLSYAITQATHHKAIDLRALCQALVPAVMTNGEFSTMTLGYQRIAPVQFYGHDRIAFISMATARRDQMMSGYGRGGEAAFELERRLKS